MGWPLVYDPEDNLAKCLQVLQESIEAVKSALSNEAILMELAESVELTVARLIARLKTGADPIRSLALLPRCTIGKRGKR